jgi:hypothetical protein
VRYEHLAGVGEGHASRVALEHRQTCLALERGDLLAHGGRGVTERVGRRAERSALGDLAQHTQTAEAEHQEKLSEVARYMSGA